MKPSFIYPEITETHYVFGSDNAGEIIRENGDWRDYLPPVEDQKKLIETSACYLYAQLGTIATILEEEYNLPDQDYSARFNALLSGGTEYGGDPLKGADSIRHDGLIPEGMMPFDTITSWEEYHSWKGVSERLCRKVGKLFLSRWKPNSFIVFRREDSIESKYTKLREALKRSPVAISVSAWPIPVNDIYSKQIGEVDNHMVECVYLDEQNRPWIRDTYSPYIKILSPFYNSDFAMRWTIKTITKTQRTFLGFLKELYVSIFN